METVKQPLIEYLGKGNPVLNCEQCSKRSITLTKGKTYFTPGRIDKWDEFEYDSLRSIYGGALHRILEREFPCRDFSIIPEVPFRHISDEDSLETLLTKWNQSVVSEALSIAQDRLYASPAGKTIYMVKGGQACLPKPNKYRPDWAGVQLNVSHTSATESNKSKNILPGDTKLSAKWSSQDIIPGPVQSEYTRGGWLLPLRQIYTYCIKGNARHGHIMTDKELVVLRVRPNLESENSQSTHNSQDSRQESASQQQGSQRVDTVSHQTILVQEHDESNDSPMSSPTLAQMCDGGRLEYKAIPWSNAKSKDPRRRNELTVNLALWWLHIMASVSSNIKDQYPPLKKVAQPTAFGEESYSSFALSETSENHQRQRLPARSRKRSHSLLSSDGSDLSDGSGIAYSFKGEGFTKGSKRFRGEGIGGGYGSKRQTRSMAVSQGR